MLKIFKINYNFLFLFLTIITFPINFKIFLFLRFQDIFAIILIILNIRILKSKDLLFIGLIFLLLSISNTIGYLASGKFLIYKLAFYYKFLMPIFFTLVLLRSNFFEKYEKEIILALYISFGLSLLYIFCYYFLGPLFNLKIKWFVNLPFYPGFIVFNESQGAGDKHLYSALIYVFLLYALNDALKHSKSYSYYMIFTFVIFVLNYTLLSRTFLLGMSFLFIFFTIHHLNLTLKIENKYKKFLICLVPIVLILIYLSGVFSIYEFEKFHEYATYKFNIPILHGDRAFNWFLYDSKFINLIFGSGFISTEIIFYDNGFLPLFFSFGFLGIVVIGLLCKKLYLLTFNFSITSYALFTSLFINFISGEYYLVSRYIFVIIVLLFLMQRSSIIKEK